MCYCCRRSLLGWLYLLSLQASALRLQQEAKERERELEQAYTRLEEGEPPTEDAAQHWNRMIRTEALRKQDEAMRKAVS